MLKRPIHLLVSLLVCGAFFGVFANEVAAAADPGTIRILTVNEATGETSRSPSLTCGPRFSKSDRRTWKRISPAYSTMRPAPDSIG